MPRFTGFFACAAFAVAYVVSGCTTSDSDKAARDASKAVQDASKAVQQYATSAPVLAAKDALLVASVAAKLAAVDVDTVTHVRVSAREGIVDLRGSVRSPSEIGRLQSAAKSVTGVKVVRAELRVDPHMVSSKAQAQDLALALRVRANIAAQAGLNALSVQPSAKGDVVALDGSVRSMALKTIVVEAARGTSGVHVVIDRVKVAR
jgi:osmotically-inducible protein OsmY